MNNFEVKYSNMRTKGQVEDGIYIDWNTIQTISTITINLLDYIRIPYIPCLNLPDLSFL